MSTHRSILPGFNNNRHLSLEELDNNIGGLPITENKLQDLFDTLDTNRVGYLTFDQVKEYYRSLESYGLEPTEKEIEETIRKHATGNDGMVSFQEFCCIALSVVQR